MRPQADFEKRTFLERVSLACREPVYSAAFAWALEDRSPLPLAQRLAVLSALSGADTSRGREVEATTEFGGVDLLFTVKRDNGPLYIAIENKIKATEREQQLACYDSRIDELGGTGKKVFLSLAGEEPRSGSGWVPVPYAALLDALCTQAPSDNLYIVDLCQALARLVAVADGARTNREGLAERAFKDPNAPTETKIALFVREMRLQKVVQRTWMKALATQLAVPSPWQTYHDESHGQALLNVQAAPNDRPGYLVGMQLQKRSLKAFCAPHPYLPGATEAQHRTIGELLETLRSALRLDKTARAHSSRNRGFRSFTIAKLPQGRKIDEWASVLKPQLARLYAAFPSVQPVPPAGRD